MHKVTNKDGEEGYDSFWACIMLHSSGSFSENKTTKNTIISCSEKNLSLFSARVATPRDNKNNTGGFTDSLCLSASSFQWGLVQFPYKLYHRKAIPTQEFSIPPIYLLYPEQYS